MHKPGKRNTILNKMRFSSLNAYCARYCKFYVRCIVLIAVFMVLLLTTSHAQENCVDNEQGSCLDGTLMDAGLCYKSCKEGYKGVGPVCWQSCPPGFRDDGAYCAKPEPYGRGVGYPWKFGDGLNLDGATARCESDHGAGQCEQNGLIIYPKCRAGFHAAGCCICSPDCVDGMLDIGVSCQKNTYGRGVGVPPAADYKTINFHPCEACVGVGDTIYLGMYGWAWGTAGTQWQSDDNNIATASGHGEVTGNKVGDTKVRLKDATHAIKTVKLTVKEHTADCVSKYMSGADVTPPQYEPGKTSFKFVFVSDTQGPTLGEAAEDPHLVGHDFAKWFASQMINIEKPSFIVHGGDVSSLGGLNKQYGKQWLDDVELMWKTGKVPAGKAAIPIYAVVGNHDLTQVAAGDYWKSKQEDWQSALWPYYFNNGGKQWPTNVSNDYKYLVYSFVYGNSIFIFTDTYFMWGSTGYDADWFGNMMIEEVNPAQLAFVEKQFNYGKSMGKIHAFVFGHSRLLPEFKDNNKTLVNLLSKSGISGAYICGHTQGLNHITLPGSTSVGFEQFVADGADADPNYYLRVEVNGDYWTVTPVYRDNNGKVWEGSTWAFGAPAAIKVALQTLDGHTLTVVNGGGLGGPNNGPGSMALHSDATAPGPWEKFSVEWIDAAHTQFALKTANGHYVTAVNGGGMGGPNDATSPIHTDATWIGSWETLKWNYDSATRTVTIQAPNGRYLTTVNGGGFGGPNNTPIHTDATKRGP